MPIYEYECTRCGKSHEALQKITDKPLTKCEACSGKLQKLISRSSFHLKGTGWYVTDYGWKRDSGSSAPGDDSSGDSTDKASKTTDKTSKTDSKADA